jgi:hypothetical protein
VNSAVAGERREPMQQSARRARDRRDTAIPLMGVTYVQIRYYYEV